MLQLNGVIQSTKTSLLSMSEWIDTQNQTRPKGGQKYDKNSVVSLARVRQTEAKQLIGLECPDVNIIFSNRLAGFKTISDRNYVKMDQLNGIRSVVKS